MSRKKTIEKCPAKKAKKPLPDNIGRGRFSIEFEVEFQDEVSSENREALDQAVWRTLQPHRVTLG